MSTDPFARSRAARLTRTSSGTSQSSQQQQQQQQVNQHHVNNNPMPPQNGNQNSNQNSRYYTRSNSLVGNEIFPPMHPNQQTNQSSNPNDFIYNDIPITRDRSSSNRGIPFPFSPNVQPLNNTTSQPITTTRNEPSPPATPQIRTFLSEGATPKLVPLSLSRSESHSRNNSADQQQYPSHYLADFSLSQPNSPIGASTSSIPRRSSANHKSTPNSAPKSNAVTTPPHQTTRLDDSEERYSPQISPACSPSLRPIAHQHTNQSQMYMSNSRALQSIKQTATIRASPRRDPIHHTTQERSNSVGSMSSSSSFGNLHLVATDSEQRNRNSIFHSLVMYFQRARKNYAKPERPKHKHSSHVPKTPTLHSLSHPFGISPFRVTARRSFIFIAIVTLFLAISSALFPMHSPSTLLRLPASFNYYLPSRAVSQIYANSPPHQSTPTFSIISLISLPLTAAGMSPAALAADKQSVQAWYSLMSWCLAVGPANVLVYVDESSTCEWLVERPEVRGIQCHKVPALHPTYKRPLLPQLFEHAHLHSSNDIIAFMSKPAFLHPTITTVVANISSTVPRFLLVTRRTNVNLPDAVLDPATFSEYTSSAYAFVTPEAPDYRSSYQRLMHSYIKALDSTFDQSSNHGKLHSAYGVDLFIYPKQIFDVLSLPPYLAGVYRWDNWLLSEVILRDDVTVVDASSEILPLLVHDGLESESHAKADGANYNDRLTKLRSGNQYKLGHTDNADYKLEGICPSCLLVANEQQTLAIEFAKHVDDSQSLVVFTHEQPMSDDKSLLLLHNLLCWTKRVAFHNYVLLVEDSQLAEYLLSHGYHVLHRALDVPTSHSGHHHKVLVEVFDLAKGTQDFVSFYVRILQFILKSGYNFYSGPSTALLLDNPLSYLDHSLDLQASVNTTDDSPGQSTFFAAHATTYGRDFMAKLKDCTDKLPHPIAVSPPHLRSCIASVWKGQKRNKNVKRSLLNHLRYSTSKQFFAAKLSQRAAVAAAVVDLTDSLDSVKEQNKLWWWLNSWSFLVYSPPTGKCIRPLYPLIAPPKPAVTTMSSTPLFSLKIKVITSFRPNALSRLLASLSAASYDDDQVELELCIDGLPVVSPTAKELDKHTQVRKIVNDFVWNQGMMSRTNSFEGSANAPSSQGRGAMGAFLRAWEPSSSNPSQVLLLLPDYVELSPIFYQYLKRLVQAYYLNPDMYDPQMFGISLQSNMPIMGTDQDMEHQIASSSSLLYRYQQFGSLGTLLFPEHWCQFQNFINNKGFDHSQMQRFAESLLNGFTNSTAASALSHTNATSMCVPGLPSNSAWLAWIDKYNHTVPTNATLKFAIDHLYPLVFDRFIYERGFYALFPHLPNSGLLVQQSRVERVRTIYSWSKEKQAKIQADIDANRIRPPALITATPFYNDQNTPLEHLALFDIHGRVVTNEMLGVAQVQSEPSHSTLSRRFPNTDLDEQLDDLNTGLPNQLDHPVSTPSSLHRPHSMVLAFRPYQYQTTNPCSIVKTHFVQEPIASPSSNGDATHAVPKRTTPVINPTKPPVTPSTKPSTINTVSDDEGEVEARTSRLEFMKKWSEGGRRE